MTSELTIFCKPGPAWPTSFDPSALKTYCPSFKTVQPLPRPASLRMLLLAQDMGYGTVVGWLFGGPTPMPLASFQEWMNLASFLWHRSLITNTLFKPGTTQLAVFAHSLEMNDRTAATYFLGMIYARYGLQQALKEYAFGGTAPGKVTVKHILHFKTLERSSLMIQPQPAVTAFANALNPDFLVQLSTGQWMILEAKGSIAPRSTTPLREGSNQVHKYNDVTLVHTGSGSSTSATISYRAVSYCYADGAGELQAEFIDPENEADPMDLIKQGAAVLTLFMPAVDCQRLLKAGASFEALCGGAPLQEVDDAIWCAVDDGSALGIPKVLFERRYALATAMSIFDAVLSPSCYSETRYTDEYQDIEMLFNDSAGYNLRDTALELADRWPADLEHWNDLSSLAESLLDEKFFCDRWVKLSELSTLLGPLIEFVSAVREPTEAVQDKYSDGITLNAVRHRITSFSNGLLLAERGDDGD